MISFFEITKECEMILGVLYFFRELLKIVCFLIPIGLILMLSIDIAKGVITNDEKNNKVMSIVTKRLIYAVVIFLLPETIFGLFNTLLADQTDESYACWKYAGEASIEDVRDIMEAQEEALAKQIEETNEELAQKAKEKMAAMNYFKNSVLTLSSSSSSSTDGTYMGQTYDLTDEELRGIANLCQHEQGSPEGAAAEASLMANRFELYGVPYANLFKYVENAGWWANAKKHVNNPSEAREEIVDAVKEVLVLGKRTLPLYVDEHDCIYCGSYGYDIISAVNNGVSIDVNDRDKYISDVTILKNRYGATYTFYSFPTENSDPFGYTETAKNKVESR